MGRLLALLIFASLASPLSAEDDLPPAPYAYTQLADPAQEAAAVELMETLRCLKCQSQSIADSDAPMAGDMRHQVRTRIAAGQDLEEIRQWLLIYEHEGTEAQMQSWIELADRQLKELAEQRTQLDEAIDELTTLRDETKVSLEKG